MPQFIIDSTLQQTTQSILLPDLPLEAVLVKSWSVIGSTCLRELKEFFTCRNIHIISDKVVELWEFLYSHDTVTNIM